jgi:glycine cleavage system H lipoate-binding protein
MEGMDIFATKGIEYLVVIAYLVLLVGFWRLLAGPRATAGLKPARSLAASWFAIRDNLFYHQGHTWAVPESADVVRVGMDDFAVRLLGRPASIELPAPGVTLRQGERGWAVKVASRAVPVLSPVGGQVVAVNGHVREAPEVVAADPYERGWLLKVKVPSAPATVKNLLSGKIARAWMDETIERLRQMQAGELGVVMPDGGLPVDGFVRLLEPERWDEVARAFLLSGDE